MNDMLIFSFIFLIALIFLVIGLINQINNQKEDDRLRKENSGNINAQILKYSKTDILMAKINLDDQVQDHLQNEYIQERMADFASNINEFNIGDKLSSKLNGKDKRVYIVTNKTLNTVELFVPRDPTKKDVEGNYTGVDSKNWFLMADINKKFKK